MQSPLDSPGLPIGGLADWIECKSIDLRRIGFRVRIIEPEPVQFAPALHLLPELVIGDLHEVLVPPAAVSTGKVKFGRIP
ncbi:MAG: hypothetical protein GX625_21565 [Clostridiaceae bacterium]|nr:hypothetical protein [Clostridiaceae bacterium]